MVQLIYASAATVPFTPDELRLLLRKARARNSLFNVSGMLLYHTGSFLQVLEGPQEHVDRIYLAIADDKRHHRSKVLLRTEVAKREFGDWSMSFADANTIPTRPEGLIDYHRTLAGLSDASTRAKQYLRFFQQGLCRQ